MVAQHRLQAQNGVPPIRYEALKECLEKVAVKASELSATLHMPRIGCGLAGGEWSQIEPIITETLIKQNTETTI